MSQLFNVCLSTMKHATSYYEWYEAAKELDRISGNEEWKANPVSSDYNFQLLQKRKDTLRKFRKQQNTHKLIYHLREGLNRKLANIDNPLLYQQCYVGTKYLIEEYIQEVSKCLDYLCDNTFEDFPFADKLKFFKQTGQSFGRSALLLSGGASFGFFHLGVIKALWEHNLIPRVISGSSSGSLATAALGRYSDEELLDWMSLPEEMNLNAWDRLDWKSALRQKSIMNGDQLEYFIRSNIGEQTFEEAFEKTKRFINITVSPLSKNQEIRLLNYLTTPHIMTWSAALASSAIPGVFPPVTLRAKDVMGRDIPYMPSVNWIDGTLTNDLPTERLSELYNVNHYIVSQTNPHVIPFISDQYERPSLWKGVKQLAQSEVKHRMHQLLSLAQKTSYTQWVQSILNEVHSIVDQKYYGDITIHPQLSFKNYRKVVSNLTPHEVRQFILEGERATWPRITMIQNHTRTSQTLEECIWRLKQQRSKNT